VPVFNSFTGKQIDINLLNNTPILLIIIVIIFIIGLLSGFYPSLYLSNFKALNIIKSDGGIGKGNKSALFLGRTLVIFQFTMSVILIIGALVVFSQLRFIRDKDIGFNKKDVISVALSSQEAVDRIDVLEEEMLKINNVISTGASWKIY